MAGASNALYILLFGLPLTGWALVSASVLNVPTLSYGHIHWPHLAFLSSLSHKAPVEAGLKQVHRYAAWFLMALVLGHVVAALRHHFAQRDDVPRRMLPFTGGKPQVWLPCGVPRIRVLCGHPSDESGSDPARPIVKYKTIRM